MEIRLKLPAHLNTIGKARYVLNYLQGHHAMVPYNAAAVAYLLRILEEAC